MEGNLPCAKHEEQIKSLYEKSKDTNKRIDEMGDIRSILHSLDKNYALQSQLMENVVEHNKKQDIRMDEQHEINIKVNDNLTRLADQYVALDDKVDTIGSETEKLAKKVDENENKHKLDIRDIDKDGKTNLLKKYGEPAVIIGAIGTILLKLLEIFKG